MRQDELGVNLTAGGRHKTVAPLQQTQDDRELFQGDFPALARSLRQWKRPF